MCVWICNLPTCARPSPCSRGDRLQHLHNPFTGQKGTEDKCGFFILLVYTPFTSNQKRVPKGHEMLCPYDKFVPKNAFIFKNISMTVMRWDVFILIYTII